MSGKLLEIMQKQHILRMELHASDRQHAAAAVVFVHCTETTKTVNKKAETAETLMAEIHEFLRNYVFSL